jgi:hypothetical protein
MTVVASSRTSKTRNNPVGLLRLGLALFPALAMAITAALAGCGGISVGDQSCTEDSKVNDKDDACPYGPPGGPKVAPGGCPNIVLTDPATCTKSWDDIFPIFTGPTANCSIGGCHGEAPGPRGIYLPANDPNAFYDELKGYMGNQGYPYINDKEPARSWILCSLAGTPGGGSPMPPPSGLTAEDFAIVEEWAQCGLKKSLTGDGGI